MSRIPKAVPPTIVGGAAIVAIALVTAACGSGGYNKPAGASGTTPFAISAGVVFQQRKTGCTARAVHFWDNNFHP